MTTVSPIMIDTYVHLYGWTWENFTAYVEYEKMFNQQCERKYPVAQENARFMLRRGGPGYSGFPTEVVTVIHLHDADGAVPPIGE